MQLFSNGFAWIVATHAPTSDKDRAQALTLAEADAQKTKYDHPQILSTLAAAYAAVSQFDQAVQAAERAIERAIAAKKKDLAEEIRERLNLYRLGKTCRESIPRH